MTALTTIDRIDLRFSDREADKLATTAHAIYERSRLSPQQAAAYGTPAGSLAAADEPAILSHVLFCAVIQRAHQITVDPAATWGQTRERIAEVAAAKATKRRRGAGARAVANRYGDEAARRITGHAVSH